MVAGHLRIQNGIYQMILSYKGKQNKRKIKSISTHLPVKGNKKKAEAMLSKARKEFIPTLWDKDTDFSTFLSDWIEGIGLKAIQEWLGHSTITTTANTYTHFDFSKKIQSTEEKIKKDLSNCEISLFTSAADRNRTEISSKNTVRKGL